MKELDPEFIGTCLFLVYARKNSERCDLGFKFFRDHYMTKFAEYIRSYNYDFDLINKLLNKKQIGITVEHTKVKDKGLAIWCKDIEEKEGVELKILEKFEENY